MYNYIGSRKLSDVDGPEVSPRHGDFQTPHGDFGSNSSQRSRNKLLTAISDQSPHGDFGSNSSQRSRNKLLTDISVRSLIRDLRGEFDPRSP